MPKILNDIPEARQKATGEIVALFALGANPLLVSIQDQVRELLIDAGVDVDKVKFTDPNEFHITAVYSHSMENIEGITRVVQSNFDAFPILVDGVGVFKTPDGYAIHLSIRRSGEILNTQDRIYYMINSRDEPSSVSSFSMPWNYMPHITLAYSPEPIFPFRIKPFALAVDTLVLSDEDNFPVYATQMKAVEEHPVFKAMELEIIEKSIAYNEDGDLVIPVIGVPFKGPIEGKRDLAGDFFHKGTDIGSTSEVNAFYDHGRDGNYIVKELKSMGMSNEEIDALGPNFGFGKHDIGVAQKAETTPDGIIFNIIVNRRAKYIKALERAAKQGLLGASGEFKSFEYDEDTPGKVNYAPIAGMVLSPTPYNVFAAVQKSVVMEDDEMGAKKVVEEKIEKAEVEEAEEVETVEKTVNPITKALQAKKEEAVEKSVEENEEETEDEIATTVAELSAQVVEQSQVLKAVGDSVEAFQTDLQTALPELAEMITKAVLDGIEEKIEEAVLRHVAKSKLELSGAVEKSVATRKTSTVSKSNSKAAPIHSQVASMSNYPGSN